MKILIILSILILIVLSSSRKNKSSSNLSNSKTKSNPLENFAKISIKTAYTSKSEEMEDELMEHELFDDGGKIEKDGFRFTYGTLAKLKSKDIVLVIRGTVPSFSNFYADLQTKLVDYSNCSGSKVHKGFLKVYNILRPLIREKFYPFVKENMKEDLKIYFLGHSLGGAVANFAAYEAHQYFKTEKLKISSQLLTCGAPRVGDKVFKKCLESDVDLDAIIRLTFKNDPIIEIPNEPDYVHAGTEYHFTSLAKYEKKKFNEDETPRTLGFIDTIKKLAKSRGDHSDYDKLESKYIVDLIDDYMKSINQKRTAAGLTTPLKKPGSS
jgi:hypothetical protein